MIHTTRCTHLSSVKPVIEEQASQPEQLHNDQPSGGDSGNTQGFSTTLFEPLLDHFTKSSHHTHTAKLGNLLLTAVHQSGIFALEVLYCICPNAVETHKQLFNSGLFPSSFKQIETVFTFTVLDDFLADNLECKTTAQQYYLKLQSITNRMFPDSVPVCYLCPYVSFHALTGPPRICTSNFCKHHINGMTLGIE
jgi:hypothetical protein